MKRMAKRATAAALLLGGLFIVGSSCITTDTKRQTHGRPPGPRPDLSLVYVAASRLPTLIPVPPSGDIPRVYAGCTINVTEVTTNLTRISFAPQSEVALYLADDPENIDIGRRLECSHQISCMDGLGSVEFTSTVTIPDDAPLGTNYIVAVCGIGIHERPGADDNNISFCQVNIQPKPANGCGSGAYSDLKPHNNWGPVSAQRGTYVTITNITTNCVGNATSSQSKVFLSTSTNNLSGAYWYTMSVGAMNPQTSRTNSNYVLIPVSKPTNLYWVVVVCATTGGNEHPTNKWNNTNAFWQINVTQ